MQVVTELNTPKSLFQLEAIDWLTETETSNRWTTVEPIGIQTTIISSCHSCRSHEVSISWPKPQSSPPIHAIPIVRV